MDKGKTDVGNFVTEHKGLKREMKGRQLLMISIGGTIGTGLFMGVGYTINTAGPLGTVLAYMVGGLVMYLVLLCLGELAAAMPVAGSFQTYATRFISPAAGFATGWLYWLSWALCIAADFTASGIIMNTFFPSVPIYIWCAVFAVLLSCLNLLSVKAYGESEFWFASIKIISIVVFILAGRVCAGRKHSLYSVGGDGESLCPRVHPHRHPLCKDSDDTGGAHGRPLRRELWSLCLLPASLVHVQGRTGPTFPG